MSEVKFCKDCVHYYISAVGLVQFCDNPEYSSVDPVRGTRPAKAETARSDDMLCGALAKGFEQKRTFWQKLGLGQMKQKELSK